MKQAEPQLLLNCPKCNSGRLTFLRDEAKEVTISCLNCAHYQDRPYADGLKAAEEWNKR